MSRILQGYKVMADGIDAHENGYMATNNVCIGLSCTWDTIEVLRKRFTDVKFTAEKVNKYVMYQNGSVKEILNDLK